MLPMTKATDFCLTQCLMIFRFDDTTRTRYTLPQLVLGFLATFGFFAFPILLCYDTPVGMPMTIAQMPRKGDPHVYYTFEPANK